MGAATLVNPIASQIRTSAATVEASRRLPEDLFASLRDNGLFSIYTPAEFGGKALPLAEGLRVVEEVARHDASTGWTVALGFGNDVFTSVLPEASARRILDGGWTLMAGSPGFEVMAARVPGGYRISGQWKYASGAANALWTNVLAPIFENGAPVMGPHGMPEMVMAFIEPSSVEIVDTWNVTGLRGSASYDLRAVDVSVPEEMTGSFSMAGAVPQRPSILASIPFMTLLSAVQAPPVCLGVAAHALELFVDLVKDKERMYAARPTDQPAVQAAVARAEAGVRAARAYFYETAHALWTAAQRGDAIDNGLRAAMRMAALNAVEASLAAVDTYWRLGGTSSIYQDQDLERCWRDVHTAAQHVQVQDARWVTAGRVLFGLEPDGPMF